MVQSDEIRVAFAARLKKALSLAQIPEWGAGARLAEITGKTPKAASKWLNGESMPGRGNMQTIASALGVRIEWLQFNEGDPTTAGASLAASPPAHTAERPPIGGGSSRAYQTQKYEEAAPSHRQAVDELADQMLGISEAQALKLKQVMELLLQADEPNQS